MSLSDVPLTIQRILMSVFPYSIILSATWIDIMAQAAIDNKYHRNSKYILCLFAFNSECYTLYE